MAERPSLRTLSVYLRGYCANIVARADLQILFQSLGVVIKCGDINKQNSARLAASILLCAS